MAKVSRRRSASIGPPNGSIAENPTSLSTTYSTLGAPPGAFGCRDGSQSGTGSLMSMLILPLDGRVIDRPRLSPGTQP